MQVFEVAPQLHVVIDRLDAHVALERFCNQLADFTVALARFLRRDAIRDALVDGEHEIIGRVREGTIEQAGEQNGG